MIFIALVFTNYDLKINNTKSLVSQQYETLSVNHESKRNKQWY
jgi:hypothetical protein